MKGVGGSLTAVVLLFSLGTAGFFGIIMSGSTIERNIKYNTGDYNEIIEAKLKSSAYSDRIVKEINYTSNNAALKVGRERTKWNLSEIPSDRDFLVEEEFIPEFKERLSNQNQVFLCSQPEIKKVDWENMEKGMNLTATLEKPAVTCSKSGANPPVIAQFSVKKILEVHNSLNEFDNLSYAAVNISQETREYIKEKGEWENATGTASSCKKDPSDINYQLVKKRAKNNAASNLEEEIADIADKIKDKAEGEIKLYDFISFSQTETDYSYGYNVTTDAGSCQVKELRTYVNGTSYPLSQVTSAVNTKNVSDYRRDCKADGRNLQWTLIPGNKPDSYPSNYACYKFVEAEKFTAEATAFPRSMEARFGIKDAENRVMNSEGRFVHLKTRFSVVKKNIYSREMFR